MKVLFSTVFAGIGLALCFCLLTQNLSVAGSTAQTVVAENALQVQESKFAKALTGLEPKGGDCGLLLGFDTDVSNNASGYEQFYDYHGPDLKKTIPNKTLFITRKGNKVKVAAKLDYIASPQKDGFVYLGQVRYFEPKPRVKNPDFESLEKDFRVKLFGFNYTRIWQTRAKNQIAAATARTLEATKAEIDEEFRKSKEKEWLQNITDYEKLSFVGDGFYIKEGFWSQVTGGPAFFQAHTKNKVVPLRNDRVSGKLKSLYAAQRIEEAFNKVKEQFGEDRWGSDEKIGYVENSTYTLARFKANTHLVGLILVDGNAHRSFHADADFGITPKSLVRYNNPKIDFAAFKQADENVIDVFVSPNQNTVFVLTKTEIIGLDVKTKNEIFRQKHDLQFNKIVMVEWATSDFVSKWEKELK